MPFIFGIDDFFGVMNSMKMTRAEIQSRYRAKHRDAVNANARRWRRENSVRVRATRAANRRKQYAQNKARIVAYKASKGCFRCPVTIPCCLEFHHPDPNTKEHQISDMLNMPWRRIEAEMTKCNVVCRNCHSIIHDAVLGDEMPMS